MKFFGSFCLLVLLSNNSNAQQFSGKQFDSLFGALAQSHRFNGSVLYAEKGKVLYKKSFGITSIASLQPLNTHSAFNLASITKQFVDMSVMILVERGRLGFDDDIRSHIPEFPYHDISIRNLMTHTSGIPEYFDTWQQYRGTLDTLNNEKLISLLAKIHPPLDFETGTKWQYCNTNYVFLAALIERISKQTLAAFIRQNIAVPLGLADTYVYQVLMPVIPANHVLGFDEINGRRKLNDLTNVDGVTGDGNLYSSVEDLYKWEQSLYTAKLVSPSTMHQAFQPVKLKNGATYPYGFGWFIKKENELYWHTGSWAGFFNLVYRDLKNKRTLIILSSGSNSLGRDIGRAFFEGRPVQIPPTFLIRHVRLIDGTGTPAREASVRIEGNKIIASGELLPFPGEPVTDGNGMVLAPGFIDSHSHLAGSFEKHPEALAAVSQGITTIISGQDGSSEPMDSLKAAYVRNPVAINMASYTGHTSIREMVMGADQLHRSATQEELDKIKILLRSELEKGSLGLSTGLEYEGAFYANRDEVLQLAKVTAAGKGRYISHIRSEDINRDDAIDEIISIGRIAALPVQISHIKIALKDDWGTAPALLAQLQHARQEGIDITADCYPYESWNSTIRVLFPKKDFNSLESANYAVTHLVDPEGSILVRFSPDSNFNGKTISAIAKLRGEDAAHTVLYLVAAAEAYEKKYPDAGGAEVFMGKSMTDADIIPLLSWPNTNICSDGANGGHPRGYGTFTRVLGHYVREQKIMSLENAIYKMTSLAAEHTGIKNRGIIAPGFYADLVLFDPEKIKDNADVSNSKALSDGILQVWVNGISVYKDKQTSHELPGMFLEK